MVFYNLASDNVREVICPLWVTDRDMLEDRALKNNLRIVTKELRGIEESPRLSRFTCWGWNPQTGYMSLRVKKSVLADRIAAPLAEIQIKVGISYCVTCDLAVALYGSSSCGRTRWRYATTLGDAIASIESDILSQLIDVYGVLRTFVGDIA